MMKKKMTFQLVSDLHLERYATVSPILFRKMITPGLAPTLALAGDISSIYTLQTRENARTFITWCSQNWKQVLFVSGNHEYHRQPAFDVKMEKICSLMPNIHFLNNKSTCIDNVEFIGSTLWAKHHGEYHTKSLTFIEEKLKSKSKKVVLTHYAPLVNYTSHPKFANSESRIRFATDLSHLMKTYNPTLWAFGHTHWCMDRMIGKTRLVSNQYGSYPDDLQSRFDPNLVLSVE